MNLLDDNADDGVRDPAPDGICVDIQFALHHPSGINDRFRHRFPIFTMWEDKDWLAKYTRIAQRVEDLAKVRKEKESCKETKTTSLCSKLLRRERDWG